MQVGVTKLGQKKNYSCRCVMNTSAHCDAHWHAVRYLSYYVTTMHSANFMITPCINDIKHFIVQLMHTTLKT